MKKVVILAVLAVLAASPAFGATFKCTDEKGVTHYGDTMPPQCAKTPVLEVQKSGSTVKRYDAQLTPEQLKAKQEEDKRKSDDVKAAAEAKRKDMALLNTYSSERDFEVAKQRNVEPIEARIKSAQDRSANVEKRIKALSDEMEFYTAGKSKTAKERKPPVQLVTDLERANNEKAALDASITRYQAEIEQMKARYETDRQRWMELRGVGTPQPAPSAAAKSQSAAPAPQNPAVLAR
jgi:chromosome segregation ATPase